MILSMSLASRLPQRRHFDWRIGPGVMAANGEPIPLMRVDCMALLGCMLLYVPCIFREDVAVPLREPTDLGLTVLHFYVCMGLPGCTFLYISFFRLDVAAP